MARIPLLALVLCAAAGGAVAFDINELKYLLRLKHFPEWRSIFDWNPVLCVCGC
jgi:hypothetical protein